MDYVEGRGVTSGNEVYFIFDAENDVVVMATYRDAPGVRSDLLKPNIVKTFSKDEWGDINEFLSAGASENEEEEAEEAEEAESSPLFQQIVPETSDEEKEEGDEPDISPVLGLHSTADIAVDDVELPKMSNAEAILPENKVPTMTKDEVQEKFDPITGTQNEDDKEEVEEDGEEDE
ncbi:hypothetical protein LCGC14_2381640 [marine sediment metagenome]|uniref:Uncharacterized protein n=1 Tax=marine sediment metagenome TaxID=412755 RepID=A0A0F9C0S7_9ZZZZ